MRSVQARRGTGDATPGSPSSAHTHAPAAAATVLPLGPAPLYGRLPVREFPDVDPPVVSVVTVYPGANPQVVETEVTEVLEEELNTIEGIRTLASTTREEVSEITIERNAIASTMNVTPMM